MARTNYQYGTSPRKIEPDYDTERQQPKKAKRKEKRLSAEERRQKELELKLKKRSYHKNIAAIVCVFLVLLAISYRNSLITEKFNEIQDKKTELAAIEKTNGQLEVSIESSLNLSSIEETAEEELDMQKLQNNQKVYVTLPKIDYTESSTEEVTDEEDSNWFISLINKIF